MNEDLKNVIIEIGMIKVALNNFTKLAKFTGGNYEKETNALLDRLITLEKKKEGLERKKKK